MKDEAEVKKLYKFGVVKTCKVINNSIVTIVLTDGFTENAMKTFEFIGECQKCFPEYPVIETCITQKDLAIIVLKK